MRDFRDRVAVITGGAQGLGLALAKELGSRGCHLALVDRDHGALSTARGALQGLPVKVAVHYADVSHQEDLVRVAEEHPRVHILINNAAVSITSAFQRIHAADFDQLMRINFMGTVNACRVFLPKLLAQQEGQIVNVCSSFAWAGYAGKTAYASSKAAVRAFSESLRLELAETNVAVTILYPGPLKTGIVMSGISDSVERRALEHRFLQERGIAVEEAAKVAVNKLRGSPQRIVVGRDYKTIDALARLSPSLAAWVLRRASGRLGF
jgi:short-subunit dehydrogenase